MAAQPEPAQARLPRRSTGAEFTWKTERALRRLQHRKGSKETGELDADAAVFLPEAVRIAKVTGRLGGPARPGAQVAQATSDTLEVQVDLDAVAAA